jgi:hypothetical protein
MKSSQPDLTNAKFDAMLHRNLAKLWSRDTARCPDAEVLAAWQDGTLSRREHALLKAHRSECSRCDSTMSALASLDERSANIPGWLRAGWLFPLVAALTGAIIASVVMFHGGKETLSAYRATLQPSLVRRPIGLIASVPSLATKSLSFAPAAAIGAPDSAEHYYGEVAHLEPYQGPTPLLGETQQPGIGM